MSNATPIELMMITSKPAVAAFAVASGVDRIMVDLEVLGKFERQGERDTLISGHSVADVAAVARAADPQRMLVRTNPHHPGLAQEVEEILSYAPASLMLPMVRSADEVRAFAELVRGRAALVPLVETAAGLRDVAAIATLPEVERVFIGLNDLHLDLGKRFMFEPVAEGLIDEAAAAIRAAGKPFGFGGIARVDEGLIPGALVLAEHIRLGSSLVILSRTFHRRQAENPTLTADQEFAHEIERLREAEQALRAASGEDLLRKHGELCAAVETLCQ